MRKPVARLRRIIGIFVLMLASMPAFNPAVMPAMAEEVVAHLSQTQVSITTNFEGSEIEIFGAVRREEAIPDAPMHVIVTVTGPAMAVSIRKRERRYGVWVNGPAVQIDTAPSLYAVASTGPLEEILSHTDNLRHRISLDEVIRLIDAPDWLLEERDDYRDAVSRLHAHKGLYFTIDDGVTLLEDTLFFTSVPLPADLVEGNYSARVFLLRDRAVIDAFEAEVAVGTVGFERIVRLLAFEMPAVYGIVAVVVALVAGWAGSAVFRWLAP
ncbi:MAG: TIGR02186 family protein [Pseudomonadota bacterium]